MTGHLLSYRHPFRFESGEVLPSIDVAYHCSDGGYHGQKVIWITHALTANSNPEEWWPGLVGPGLLFDTEKYFVICGNMLGSCYGTSGPSSVNPATGRPYCLDFPKVTVRDIVNALNVVREDLGIKEIDLIVGASIGGFQALEFSIMYPDVIKNALYMATLERVRPWLTAFEETQRMALEADPTFREAASLDGGKAGLKCARCIALLSYRCEDGVDRKQWEQDEDTMFADRAASYMRHQATKFVERFDAYSYWYLSYSVDSENVGRGRGSVGEALSKIRAKATVVGIDSDLIFPAVEVEKMAGMIKGADYHLITSHYGHDGFLLENAQISEIAKGLIDKL